ncbi:MAG: hypothetical protein ACI4S2_03065 [Lachnospiraceae bacterium]
MKKKLAGLLAALMVLSMSTTVFAEDSPTAADVVKKADVSSATIDGQEVTLTKSTLSTNDYKKAVEEAGTKKVLAAFNLTADGQTITAERPLIVTFSVVDVTADDTVDTISLLHYCTTHGCWETIKPSSVVEGKVTASFHSLSPVAIVKTAAGTNGGGGAQTPGTSTGETINNYYNYYTNPSATSGSTSSNANNSGITQTNNNNQVVNVYTTAPAAATPGASTSNTSPKTGANVPVLPIIAVLSIMGIAVCSKKALSL